MSSSELLALFLHFLSLSVFATGGAIALASDMHRYVVDRHGYITHTQFVDSIAWMTKPSRCSPRSRALRSTQPC